MRGIAAATRQNQSAWIWAALMVCAGHVQSRPSVAESGVAAEAVATPIPVAAHAAETSSQGGVGPVEAQCGAARASSLGSLLDSKRAAVTGPRHAIHAAAAREAHIRRIVLSLAAEEARNQDAGTALEIYWSLAEAEHSLPEVDAAIAAAELALADQTTLLARGLDLPLDDAVLRGRRLALDDARISTVAAVQSLSTSLAHLAKLPDSPIMTVHPSTGRAAVDEPLDVDALVAKGLAQRPQLRMLRAMLVHLSDDTAEVGSMVLSLVSPGLGGDGKRCPTACGKLAALMHRCRRCSETASIGRQLRQLLADREAAVTAEIRRAATLTIAAAERIANAERQQQVAEQSAADKQARQTVNEADAFAVHLATIEVTAARRAVVERQAGWERARARIWMAQGVLAQACGCGR